ncbi:MAG: flagellar hook-basal body complex protein FliE [Phycisphaeraceae bacterium]
MTDPLGLIGAARGNMVPKAPAGPGAPGEGGGPSFNDVLLKNIEQVNKLQQDAEHAIEDLTTGKRDDVAGVLIAKQKADMAFQMLQQVRNKLVDAYEEIKQMRV